MEKVTERTGETRPPSKYAKKLADKAAGIRKPFDFQGWLPDESTSPVQREPLKAPIAPRETGVVRAVVILVAFDRGYLMLRNEEIGNIYLPFNVFQRDYGNSVRVGFSMDCKIEPHPNGKGPRAVRILSVTPPGRS